MNQFPAIAVTQPIGQFFICTIPYTLLQSIAIPDALTLVDSGEHLPGYFQLTGNQREEIKERRKSIGDYISTVEATFPNTIILAANVNEDGSILDDDDPNRWAVEYDEACKIHKITIPTNKQIARIIDGQHRIRGFQYSKSAPDIFELPCAIFFDLSMPEQATIFATININQKRVDRSLAYNLFAYNLNEEPEAAWAPDKLAVFFTRRLGVEKESPLNGHIKVIARQGKSVYKADDWYVSTSVVVDGICSLFSKNPVNDRNLLYMNEADKRNRNEFLKDIADSSPLRNFYLESNDLFIYKIIFNFFKASEGIILSSNRGLLTKSIGIQALFDFLKELCYIAISKKDISVDFFKEYFKKLEHIDFNKFGTSSNEQGRRRIRNFLLYANNLETGREIKAEDKVFYDDLLSEGIDSI